MYDTRAVGLDNKDSVTWKTTPRPGKLKDQETDLKIGGIKTYLFNQDQVLC